MKRYLSVFLALLCLLTSINMMCFADDHLHGEEGYAAAWEMANQLGYRNSNQINPLQLKLQYNEDGTQDVYATYTPSKLVEYLLDNPYYNWSQNHPHRLELEIKIDDSPWMYTYDDLGGPVMSMFNLGYESPTIMTNTYTWKIFSNTFQTAEPLDGVFVEYADYQNGTYTLDLTKHTLYVRYRMTIYVDYLPYYGEWSRESKVQFINTNETPTELPTPIVLTPVYSIADQKLTYRLDENSTINALAGLGHDIETAVTVFVNDKQFTTQNFALHEMVYYTVTLDIPDPQITDTVRLEIQYYDKNTNSYSQVNAITAQVQLKTNDNIPSLQPVNPKPQQPVTESKCQLCNKCTIQPLGICLWIFIPICITGVTTTIFGVLMITNSKHNNTSKEKKSCPSKNSKTHK